MTGRVLLTGASGFVGRAVLGRLVHADRPLTLAVRSAERSSSDETVREFVVGDMTAHTDWRGALENVDVVVHAAARAHVMREDTADPLKAFLSTNTDAALALARQAASAGIRRFVFVSSIKVHGERTRVDKPWRESDPFAPEGPYAISKQRAERGLAALCSGSGMELVCIRPPLVYGPGARGNFLALTEAVRRGVVLPLGSIDNRRSLVGLDNLADLIMTCIDHPAAAGHSFFASDGEDLSTPDLVRRLAISMNRPARLLPCPLPLLQVFGTLLGRRDAVDRLCSSLRLDISLARDVLGWTPPVSVDEGLRRAVGRP